MTRIKAILLFLLATESSSSRSQNPSEWYTRYPFYPQYCSTPDQLSSRKIPPLLHGSVLESSIPTEDTKGKYITQILHATTIIRHGARTPWTSHNCWSGFWSEDATTAVWDCALTTMTSPPAKPEISFVESLPSNTLEDEATGIELDGLGAMFLYEKRYDALQSPQYNLKNELNGTCQKGQLLLRGYGQELHNGKMLRSTYLREDRNPISEHMALFDLTKKDQYSGHNGTKRPYEAPHLYVRADDEERTIMSGQVLLRGIFGDLVQKHWDELAADAVANATTLNVINGAEEDNHLDPTIVVHTADKWNDILNVNENVCPRLKDLYIEAENSTPFLKRFVDSDESKTMRKLLSELGGDFGDSGVAQDCMMTAICNDLDLPKVLDDYGKNIEGKGHPYGKNLFNRLNSFSYQPFNYVLRYNNAAYSKLAFGPLWVEILSNILPHLKQGIQQQYNGDGKIKTKDPPPKLAIFSAHDLTILPLLATLGEEVWDGEDWAPYASLIVIEIHDIINSSSAEVAKAYPSGQAFRLVYNGDVVTPKMRGCLTNSDLCDISILLDRVLSFATEDRDCDSTNDANTNFATLCEFPVNDAIMVLFSSWKGILVVLLTVVASGMFGCLISFVVLSGRFPNFLCIGRQRVLGYSETTTELNNDEDHNTDNSKLNPSYGTANQDTVIHIT